MNNPKQILNDFIECSLKHSGSNNNALITITAYETIDPKLFSTNFRGINWKDNLNEHDKFDYIVADLPFGMNRSKVIINSIEYKIRENWIYLIEALNYLNKDGIGQFVVEPFLLFSREGEILKEIINSLDYHVSSVFNMPKDILKPYASIRPILLTVQKNKLDKLFVGEIEEGDHNEKLVRNFFGHSGTDSIGLGELVNWDDFNGFDQYKAKKQTEILETQYNEYKKFAFKDCIKQINIGKPGKHFMKIDNSIYIPKLGTTNPVCFISDLAAKEQHYFQVVLKETISNQYLAIMFKSDLGKLILRASRVGSIPLQISKNNLIEMNIPVPDIDIQHQIGNTYNKLNVLKVAIDKFEGELALNPTSSVEIVDRLDQIVEVLGELTDADYIRNIIRKGESKIVEFKETFGYDINKDSKEKYIETASLKTIIGFLNTDGGVLLIGVDDNGKVKGADTEIQKFYKSNDKYLLNFKNRIKDRIGEQYYPLINYKISVVDKKSVLVVECFESDKPCYLDGSDFYVRTNPATDKLTGPKLVEYVSNHFKKI
jgi:hypothetical protein